MVRYVSQVFTDLQQNRYQAMAEARQVVSVMSLIRVQSEQPLSGAVGWFVSGRTLWLLPRDATSSAELQRPVNIVTLASELLRLVHQTLAVA